MPLDPEVDLAGLLLLVLGQEVGGIRQRLHALDHRVKKHDHAADERPAEDRVLFLDKVQLVDLSTSPSSVRQTMACFSGPRMRMPSMRACPPMDVRKETLVSGFADLVLLIWLPRLK